MSKIDDYDLLLETLGYSNTSLGITFRDLVLSTNAVSKLIKEIGVNVYEDVFDLIMINDDIISEIGLDDDLSDLQYIIGVNEETCREFYTIIQTYGKVTVFTANYQEAEDMRNNLIMNGYAVFIRRSSVYSP